MNISVAYCTDDKYVIPCAVSLSSFFEHHKDDVCAISIITFGLTKENEVLFQELASYYHQSIEIKVVDISVLKKLKICERFPSSIYLRFLLPDLLSGDKVLYLDSDVIVRKHLGDLFDTELGTYPIGAIEEQSSDDITHYNRLGKLKHPYFNSGVLLMNLGIWRVQNLNKKLIRFIADNPEKCLYPDQDALNCIIDDVKSIGYTYNYQHLFFEERSELRLSKDKWKYVDEVAGDPAIVHYTGHAKPWFFNCDHPHQDWFTEYAIVNPIISQIYKTTQQYSIIYRMLIRLSYLLENLSKKFV